MNIEGETSFPERTLRILDYLEELYQVAHFGKVREIKEACEDLAQSNSEFDFSSKWHLSQYQSALEFLIVFDFYRAKNIVLDRKLVRSVCRGQLVTPEETGISRDRDYFFELKVARYFLVSGFNVDLSTEADVAATFGDKEIYVECKRLWSEKNAHKRIKEAEEQIKRRLEGKGKKSAGWIFIDASFLFSEGKTPYPYRDVRAPITAMRTELKSLGTDILRWTKTDGKQSASYLTLTSKWTAIGIGTNVAHPMTTTIPITLRRNIRRWEKQCYNRLATDAQAIDNIESIAMVSKP